MPEPSKFIQVRRTVQFKAEKTFARTEPSKIVDKAYAKAHPKQVIHRTVFTAKKSTKTVRKGQRVSEKYAKRFPSVVKKTTTYRTKPTSIVYKKGVKVPEGIAKRFPKHVKKTEWVEIAEREIKFDPVKKRQVYGAWRVQSREKMNFFEKILPLKSISTRSVSDLLARNKVYSNIWQNNKGVIRMTIEGIAHGRRIKEVVHIGYLKSMWYDMPNGYSRFKKYVVHKILRALGKRRLRISNSKESLERIVNLRRMLNDAKDRLDYATGSAQGSTRREIKGLTRLIREQKQTSQVTQATLRIEKLVNH